MEKLSNEELEEMKRSKIIVDSYYENLKNSNYEIPEKIQLLRLGYIIFQLQKDKAKALHNVMKYSLQSSDDTAGHCLRVAELSVNIFEEALKFQIKNQFLMQQRKNNLYIAALIHDIGKTHTNLIVFNPLQLTQKERALLPRHCMAGYCILKNSEFSDEICNVAKEHHERYDGKGYPDQKIGKQISEFARCVAVCDVYDALNSDRGYHKGKTSQEALNIMEKNRGAFDFIFFNALKRVVKKKEEKLNRNLEIDSSNLLT